MKSNRVSNIVLLSFLLIHLSATAGTLRYAVVGQEDFLYQSVMTEFYVVEGWDDGVLSDSVLIRQDGDYLMYYGDLVGGVPDFESVPSVVSKIENITPGDSWVAFLEGLPTHEVAAGIVQKTVPAGTFTAMEIDMYDAMDHSVYVGKKWLAENVGLLGSEGEFLGVTSHQLLTSYTHVGGSTYWPMAVGNDLVFETGESWTVVDAPYATITVDGDPSDWASYDPAVEDPEGDDPSGYGGVDIKELYIANDDVNLYMMFSFWDGGPTVEWGGSRTGAYQVYVMPDDDESEEIGYISYYEPDFWFLSAINFGFNGNVTACDEVMECSIPLENLGNPPSLFRYSLNVGDMDEPYDKSNMVGVNLADAPTGCCGLYTEGLTGNNNCSTDGKLTLGDITTLIDHVYISRTPLCCFANGNVNGSVDCKISLGDITGLIDAVYISGTPPAGCISECEL